MIRLLSYVVFLVIVAGVMLHFQVDLPWYCEWIGKLPGDMIIKKGDLTIYIPLTTSVVVSSVLFLFSKK